MAGYCQRCGHKWPEHSHKDEPDNPAHVGEAPDTCSDCRLCDEKNAKFRFVR